MTNNNLYTVSAWRPKARIAGDWLTIFGAIAISMWLENPIVTAASLFLIGCRQHGLFVLVHEGVHQHLSRNKFLNDNLSDLFCAWPVLFDTFAYRRNHLAHHRHLNTQNDPDWVRKVGHPEWTFPTTKGKVARFIPYFLFLKGPLEWAYIVFMFSGFAEKARWQTQPGRLVFKACFYAATAFAIYKLGIVEAVLFYWALPLFLVFPIVQRLRSASEHFALPLKNELTSSRDVLTSWLEGFLLSPHNVNYHLTHHSYPYIPCYALPQARIQLAKGSLKDGYTNHSYLFPFENSVLEDFLRGPQSAVKKSNAA